MNIDFNVFDQQTQVPCAVASDAKVTLCKYHLAIILQSLYASEDEYFIVEKYLTDTDSGKVEISDTVSFQSLVEAIVSKGNHDTFNSFRLAYVIIKESDNGTELVTMSRTVITYYDDKTDPIRETLTCKYNGKTVFYKIISCNGGIAIRLQ